MKNIVTLCACLVFLITVLMLRSVVYYQMEPEGSLVRVVDEKERHALQLHFHERRPYFVKYKGDVYGLIATPVAKVMKQAGIDFDWIETPANRQLDIIRENSDAICAIGTLKTPQRQRFAKFSEPIYQNKQMVAVTRADNNLMNVEEEVERVLSERRLRLLLKSGYSYGSYIDQKIEEYSSRNMTTTVGNLAILEMILDYRADYCFMTEEEAYDLLVYSGLNNADFKIVFFRDVTAGDKRYLICSRKVKDGIIDVLNRSINHLIKLSD